MTQISRSTLILSFILALAVSAFSFGNDAPAWLKQAASINTPSYEKDVPAVVLRDEQETTVNENGKIVTIERYAIKILNREGRNFAIAHGFYLVSAGKVRDIEAWTIYSNDSTKDYGKKETLDVISDPDDVYNEGRLKVIDASNDVNVGDVFGYVIETENPPLFYQDIWQFQGRLPTINSRYILNLPTNWTASSITFNHSDVKPSVNGSSYTWQLDNLAPIPPEPMSPSVNNLAPFMAVNFTPADSGKALNRTFDSWKDVSKWSSGLYDPQVVVNDEIAAKARELTANSKTELDKIKAIGTYVQNLQYISIDIGVAYGNGYKPRSSDTVMARGYGDCKDKANLMRAMLQALKIDAYPVAIFSGDPTYVRKEWASPRQFNHCIIAVRVSKETEAPTIIENETLGRLLIFDATDDMTPVGDLPDYLQGSYALVMAGENGGLLEMPTTPPENNSLERNVEVKLTENGSITGKIHEETKGQSSRQERTIFRRLSKSDYQKTIEQWLTGGATAAKLINLTPKDNHSDATFDLQVEFSAPSYGQLMQDRLLIFKPAIVSRSNSIYLTDKNRTHPVSMDSNSFNETAIFDLPEGFKVDEMPDAVNLKTSFGKYSTSYEIKDGKLIFKRSLVTSRMVVPTEKYSVVRDFYSKIRDAEQSPVVLLRK
ncbi:MAG: transglutaminase-like domain-containing protein [Aridibacter sp.]